MNWVDIILLLVLLFAVIGGWYRGFILGSLDLIAWAGSLILGYLCFGYTATTIDRIMNLGVWLQPLSFIVTVILARVLIGVVNRMIIRSIPEHVNRAPLNRFFGVIPGVVNGFLYMIIIAALLLSLPLRDSITEATRDSRFAGTLAMQSEWANKKLAPVFDDAVRQTMNSLTINPKSHERVTLPYKYNKAVPEPTLEQEMLALVNEERTSRGIRPLEADPEMTIVARAHSNDMFTRGYFSHISPEGVDPFQRMRNWNISFLAAGENLALAQTLKMAHTNLMNSPGHKANILNPAFGRLGIGVLNGGFYGLMISQEFRN